MATGSSNMTTYKASQVIGNDSAQNPAGALLQSGAGRADNSTTGDTWIFLDTYSGTASPWGIKHSQGDDKIKIIGNSTDGFWVTMNTGDTYILGKVGIGYDPETSGNTYKLYVNGISYFNNSAYFYDKIGIGYDPETQGNTDKLYVNGTSNFADTMFFHNDGSLQIFTQTNGQNYEGSNTENVCIQTSFDNQDYTYEHFASNLNRVNLLLQPKGGQVYIGLDLTNLGDTNYKLYVNGNSYYNGNTTHNGIDYFANGTTYYINNNADARLRYAYTNACIGYDAASFISSSAGSAWPYIRFDTRDGGTAYVTTAQTNWCELYAQVPAKRASDNACYKTRFFFRQYSKTANTTTRLGYYEDYYLPETNDDRTGNAGYDIRTSKSSAYNVDTATHLSSAPNNTTTFYRGDKTWTNVLGGAFQANGTITANGGYLKSTLNSNTVTIGSANTGFCHFQNSANIPFYFNKTTLIDGNLGNTSYPVNNIYIGKANGAGIYYQGTKASCRMIRFVDNASDANGNGISIGGGGLTVLGSGESADTILSSLSLTASGGSETTYIASDNSILFYPGQQSYDAAAKIEMSAGRIWAGVNGNTTRENQIGVQSGAGQIYLYSVASTSGNRGLYASAHGSGGAIGIITVNTNNSVAVYSHDTWGGKLRMTDNWLGFYSAALNTGTRYGHIQCNVDRMYFRKENSTANLSYYFDFGSTVQAPKFRAGNDNAIYQTDRCNVYAANGVVGIHSSTNRGLYEFTDSKWIIYLQHSDDTVRSSYKIYGAVWNDFAEMREGDITEGGYAVYDDGHGYMKLCTERLQPGARLTSDTFGIVVGHTETAKTPIGVAGRVLAYPAQDRINYKVGDAVCSAPGGKIDLMTREEIMIYPERILGTVSEIPDYEVWNQRYKAEEEKEYTETNIAVNGRIWIYIK